MAETLGVDVPDAFDPAAPYAIEHLSRALTRLTRDGKRYLETLPLTVFFAPQGNRWSPAEHIRHLRKSSAPLLLAYRLPSWLLRLRFGAAQKPSRTFEDLRRDYRALLIAGGKAGRFAPTPESAPLDPGRRREEILSRWQSTNETLATEWERWQSLELDRACLPHPLLGKLTAREMAIFTVYHTSHHLSLIASRVEALA